MTEATTPRIADKVIDTLGLSERAYHEILAKIRHETDQGAGVDRRIDERIEFLRPSGLPVTIHQIGGSTNRYLVRPRNLSRRGIGFLHGHFLYGGTRCTVHLQTLEDEPMMIGGTVVWCGHIHGMVHDVGVRFDSAISVGDYIDGCGDDESERDQHSASPQFVGQALYLEGRSVDRELLRFMLETLGVDLDLAADVEEAVNLLHTSSIQIVFVGEQCESDIARLRKAEYCGPILLVTADEDAVEARARATAAGANEVLTKPYTNLGIAALIEPHLQPASPSDIQEPIVSECWAYVKMRPLILRYLAELEEQISGLQIAIDAEDLKTVATITRTIHGDAGSYGYPQIGELARQLHNLVESKSDSEEIQSIFDELKQLAMRAGLVRRSSPDE